MYDTRNGKENVGIFSRINDNWFRFFVFVPINLLLAFSDIGIRIVKTMSLLVQLIKTMVVLNIFSCKLLRYS